MNAASYPELTCIEKENSVHCLASAEQKVNFKCDCDCLDRPYSEEGKQREGKAERKERKEKNKERNEKKRIIE